MRQRGVLDVDLAHRFPTPSKSVTDGSTWIFGHELMDMAVWPHKSVECQEGWHRPLIQSEVCLRNTG